MPTMGGVSERMMTGRNVSSVVFLSSNEWVSQTNVSTVGDNYTITSLRYPLGTQAVTDLTELKIIITNPQDLRKTCLNKCSSMCMKEKETGKLLLTC